MALTVTVTLGINPEEGVEVTAGFLRLLGLPNVSIAGTVGTSDMADGSVTFVKLSPDLVLGGTTISTIEGTDLVLIGDDSTDSNAVISLTNLWGGLQGLGAVATSFNSFDADTLTYLRASDGTAQKMTIAYFAESLINQAPLVSTPMTVSDGVLVTKAGAAAGSRAQKVDLNSLLPSVITAGTYPFPSSITVRADGRVTAIASTSGNKNSVAGLPVPASTGATTAWAHLLGARPRHVDVTVVCVNALGSAGHPLGTELDIDTLQMAGVDDESVSLTVERDATNVTLIAPAYGVLYMHHRTTGLIDLVASTDWTISIEVTI
jgi:hypothetical protein